MNSNYRSAVLMAANLGEYADTTAAVAGQLAGALYGVSGIPSAWVSRVAWRERIIETLLAFFGGLTFELCQLQER